MGSTSSSTSSTKSSTEVLNLQQTINATETTDLGTGTNNQSFNFGGLLDFLRPPTSITSIRGSTSVNNAQQLHLSISDGSEQALDLAKGAVVQIGEAFDANAYLADNAVRGAAELVTAISDSAFDANEAITGVLANASESIVNAAIEENSNVLENAIQTSLDLSNSAITQQAGLARGFGDVVDNLIGTINETNLRAVNVAQDGQQQILSLASARDSGFSDTQIKAFVTVAGLAVAAIIVPQIFNQKKAA